MRLFFDVNKKVGTSLMYTVFFSKAPSKMHIVRRRSTNDVVHVSLLYDRAIPRQRNDAVEQSNHKWIEGRTHIDG